ncbi:hypothetical protein ScPMuIL_006960 [Solemya velum]
MQATVADDHRSSPTGRSADENPVSFIIPFDDEITNENKDQQHCQQSQTISKKKTTRDVGKMIMKILHRSKERQTNDVKHSIRPS